MQNTVTCSGDTLSVHCETTVDRNQTGAFKGQRPDLDGRDRWCWVEPSSTSLLSGSEGGFADPVPQGS